MRLPDDCLPRAQFEPTSHAVVKVSLLAPNGTLLPGSATGFVLGWNEHRYFVTNRHVVTQKNFNTDVALNRDFCGLPYRLLGSASLWSASINEATGTAQDLLLDKGVEKFPEPTLDLPISDSYGNLDPGWTLSETADIAVFRLGDEHGVQEFDGVTASIGMLDGTLLNTTVVPRPMQSCFIIGFPGLGQQYANMRSPIYKSATLAVEPDLCDPRYALLVDGKTKKGMSGSPVVFRCTCGSLHLLGVYSGREIASEDLTVAELGMVWRFRDHLAPLLELAEGELASGRTTAPSSPVPASANHKEERNV